MSYIQQTYYRSCGAYEGRLCRCNKESNETFLRLCQLGQILDNNLRWIWARNSESRTGRLNKQKQNLIKLPTNIYLK